MVVGRQRILLRHRRGPHDDPLHGARISHGAGRRARPLWRRGLRVHTHPEYPATRRHFTRGTGALRRDRVTKKSAALGPAPCASGITVLNGRAGGSVALYPGARRRTGRGGGSGAPLSRWAPSGRLPRSRPLLRAVGLSDYVVAARRERNFRSDRPARVLGAPGA